jgi:tRNA A-37 threonylcarbamoyl transferase component Bud32
MQLDDCEMLDVFPERGAINYRLRNRRTGAVVFLHILPDAILPDAGLVEPAASKLLNRLPPGERTRILDHGTEGRLTYFVTEGLPGGDGFLRWFTRATAPGKGSTLEDGRHLRDLFEHASRLPEGERTAFVRGQGDLDVALGDKVLAMLHVAGQEGDFLEVPAPQQIAADAGDPEPASPGGNEIAADQPEFAPGICINDRYLIEDAVGRGGFGIIYRARDLQVHNRPVVLKVSKGDAGPVDAELMMRFQREVASLSRITHPSVVGVLDAGRTSKGTPFFVMQYVPGHTLRQKLRAEGPFPLARVANIVKQISHALTVTHSEGICHRDLKPENVMLQDLGDGEELAIIIDFGIATIKEREHGKTLMTRAIGTRAYMPPEQLKGRPVPASDTFALGIMTWEMIAGRNTGCVRKTRPQREIRSESGGDGHREGDRSGSSAQACPHSRLRRPVVDGLAAATGVEVSGSHRDWGAGGDCWRVLRDDLVVALSTAPGGSARERHYLAVRYTRKPEGVQAPPLHTTCRNVLPD